MVARLFFLSASLPCVRTFWCRVQVARFPVDSYRGYSPRETDCRRNCCNNVPPVNVFHVSRLFDLQEVREGKWKPEDKLKLFQSTGGAKVRCNTPAVQQASTIFFFHVWSPCRIVPGIIKSVGDDDDASLGESRKVCCFLALQYCMVLFELKVHVSWPFMAVLVCLY